MTSAVTYEGVVARSHTANDDTTGLFAGQKLWFSRSVPQRDWLMRNAEANGATITAIDTQADIILFDHARRNAPPGSFSYKYVEVSIRKGILESLEDHRITSDLRVDRPVGSVKTASKGSRNAYTDAEDQLLWNWMKPYMDAGGQWKGNEIYKQLERHNPRHTYQSWRDRWIKHTQYQNRHVTQQAVPAPPESYQTEPSAERPLKRRKVQSPTQEAKELTSHPKHEPVAQVSNPQAVKTSNDRSVPDAEPPRQREPETESRGPAYHHQQHASSLVDRFSTKDIELLMKSAPSILLVHPAMLDYCWKNATKDKQWHTTDEWKTCFEEFVIPKFRRENGLNTEEQLNEYLREYSTGQEEIDEEQRSSAIGLEHSEEEPSLLRNLDDEFQDILDPLSSRPPEPNESRKRSQGRSTQSDSNQSQSQSQTLGHSQSMSKTSQIQGKSEDSQAISNASLPDIPYRTESILLGRKTSLSPNTIRAADLLSSIKSPQGLKRPVNQDHSPPLNLQATNLRNASISSTQSDTLKRGVTKMAGSQSTQMERKEERPLSHAIDDDEEWIPPRTQAESPLFFPDDAADDQSTSNDEEDDDDNEEDRLTSETAQARTSAATTQVFETAPQDMISQHFSTHSSLEEITAHGVELHRSSQLLLPQQEETQFETAPTVQRSGRRVPDHREPPNKVFTRKQSPPHSSDQALIDNVGDFSIPPPEGGWSDDEDEVEVIREVSKASKSIKQESPAAKDPTSLRSDTVATDDDIETWLSHQKTMYREINDLIVDEICIKALEATSLQLGVATVAVDALVLTYTKGKHPAIKHVSQFFNEAGEPRNMPKRDSKRMHVAISKMVDELMLTDHRGVWTKTDDQKLMSTNARSVEEVEQKHGEDGVRLRFEYLDQLYQDT